MNKRRLFFLLISHFVFVIAPLLSYAQENVLQQLTEIINSKGGTGTPGGMGYSISYQTQSMPNDQCQLTVEEKTTINQRSVSQALVNIFVFHLSDLDTNFNFMDSMGNSLVIFKPISGKAISYEAVGRTISAEEKALRSSSIGFHFKEDIDARNFSRLMLNAIEACQK